jgi:hypothetical protein
VKRVKTGQVRFFGFQSVEPWAFTHMTITCTLSGPKNNDFQHGFTRISYQMFPRLLRFSLTALVAFVLSSCGGGDSRRDNGSLEVDEVRLASLEVAGFDLLPEFSSERLGPYRFEVSSGTTSITLSAVAVDADNVTMIAAASGMEEALDISSNQAFDVPLDKGQNAISITITNAAGVQRASYQLLVRRESDEAFLQAITFDANAASAVTAVAPETFDPEVFAYEFDAEYTLCSVGIRSIANVAHTQVSVNGVSVNNNTETFVNLLVGENLVGIDLVSEDGSATARYELTINRAEGTNVEQAVNTNLQSLSIENADINTGTQSGFICGFPIIEAAVNNDQDTASITLVPELTDAPLFIGPLVLNSENLYEFESTEAVTAGEPYVIDLAEGVNQIGFSVNEVGSSTITHRLEITRRSSNFINVSNGVELQQALINAMPNQEIVLSPGDYEGSSELASSGMDGVHFYSAASGTEDEPIILRGDGTPVLYGTESTAALLLSGDHWRVAGINVRDAETGVILDGANHSILEFVSIADIQQRGLVVRNGSSNNSFQRLQIRDTGQASFSNGEEVLGEAMVIGSDDSEWQSAPTPGPYLSSNDGNYISNSFFGPSVSTELLDIKEGSTNTVIQFNSFFTEDVGVAAEASAAVVVKGNETELRYNEFADEPIVDHAVAVRNPSESWHTETWGASNIVHNNRFESSAINSVSTTDNVVLVATNLDRNETPVGTDGTAISEITNPTFAIQTIGDDPECLTHQIVQINVAASGQPEELRDFDVALLDECSSAANQSWTLINHGPAELEILSNDGDTLAPISNDFVSVARELGLYDEDGPLPEFAFMGRWFAAARNADELQFSNKHYSAVVMTKAGVEDAHGSGLDMAVAAFNLNAANQRFKLVRR